MINFPLLITNKVIIVAAVLLLLIGGCEMQNSTPNKPSIVPALAKWYGAEDGGSWIDCKTIGDASKFRCSVWNEIGDVFLTGVFQVVGSKNSEFDIVGFDGEAITLTSGFLYPIGTHIEHGPGYKYRVTFPDVITNSERPEMLSEQKEYDDKIPAAALPKADK